MPLFVGFHLCVVGFLLVSLYLLLLLPLVVRCYMFVQPLSTFIPPLCFGATGAIFIRFSPYQRSIAKLNKFFTILLELCIFGFFFAPAIVEIVWHPPVKANGIGSLIEWFALWIFPAVFGSMMEHYEKNPCRVKIPKNFEKLLSLLENYRGRGIGGEGNRRAFR